MNENVFLVIIGCLLILQGVILILPFVENKIFAKRLEKQRKNEVPKAHILGIFTVRTYSDNAVVLIHPTLSPLEMKQIDFLFYFDPPLNGEGRMLGRRVLVTEIRCGEELIDYRMSFV